MFSNRHSLTVNCVQCNRLAKQRLKSKEKSSERRFNSDQQQWVTLSDQIKNNYEKWPMQCLSYHSAFHLFSYWIYSLLTLSKLLLMFVCCVVTFFATTVDHMDCIFLFNSLADPLILSIHLVANIPCRALCQEKASFVFSGLVEISID